LKVNDEYNENTCMAAASFIFFASKIYKTARIFWGEQGV
jgi:hypothetical protein